MKNVLRSLVWSVCLLMVLSPAMAQTLAPIDGMPLAKKVSAKAKPVSSGKLLVPMITWGGDVATVMAEKNGVFKREGLDVELFVENNFPRQVEACLSGRTPFLRGTMGMINSAVEVFDKAGVDLVVIYQLTWSVGGDAMVVRKNVKSPKNLKGKTVALQLFGPHMDYLANILNSGRVPLGSISYKWFEELTLPPFDTGGKIVDPVSAFLNDSSIDATLCIIPDALNLTSGGKTGTGASGSVKGAKILLSTKTASRVIADVYAVREDYFKANKSKVEKYTRALFQGQEKLYDLLKNKKSNQADYQQLLGRCADLLLGAPQATPDVEALLGDCEFVGFDGNVGFFTGKGTTRNLNTLTKEIQTSFKQLGLLSSSVKLASAQWNYSDLGRGLKYASKLPEKKPKFDTRKVAAKVEKRISVEPTTWAEEGTLFVIEVNFSPNQSTFSQDQYADDFKKALSIAQTYGGALIIVEGHSDPLGILKARKERRPSVEISQMEQQAKNLSLERSRAVRQSFLGFCKTRNYGIDESQFVSVGMGAGTPKFSPPRTKEEWAANRRVVFRIKQIEAELDEFIPLD